MKLSRKQIIYGSILTAAGIAWGIDAAFVGPPAPAHGGQLAPEKSEARVPQQETDEKTFPDNSEHVLTARLHTWAARQAKAPDEILDVFQSKSKPKPVVVTAATETRPADPSIAFVRRHRLIAVVLDASGGYALIDGQMLQVGQGIDGARLIGLKRGEARFTTAGQVFSLPLTPDVVSVH